MKLSPAALSLLALACCVPQPPVPTAPEPPPPPPAPTSATTTLAPSAAPAAPPPPLDPAADPAKLELVRALCPAAIRHADGQVQVGCRACPPFDDPSAGPDGTVAVDPETFFPLEALYPGAFSKPGAREVAAVFTGCEPHAGNYGGTLFAERTATGFRTLLYASGLHPAACQVYHRPDGRDLLVCRWSDAHQSTAFTEVLAYDLTSATAADPLKGWSNLVTVTHNAYSVCWGVSPEAGVLQGEVLGFRFEDRNRDGRPDVVVDVRRRATPYSAKLDQAIQKACAAAAARTPDDMPTIDVASLVGQPAKLTVELLWDGQGFRPSGKAAALSKSPRGP